MPKKVEEKIRYLIRKFPHTEWSGILFYSHTGNFENGDLEIHCEDIYPMDLGSGTFTDFKMDASVVAYIADNIDLFGCEMGLVHSHHSMGAFISGTDANTLASEGNDTNCFVSLVVDTRGTYVAAITRKVHKRKEVITKVYGSTYEFFGDGERILDRGGGDGIRTDASETVIEYFMLDVQREETNNPFDYLDARFEEIEAKKKPANMPIVSVGNTIPTPKWNTDGSLSKGNDFDKDAEDKDFYDWIHQNRKTEQPTLFTNEEMGDIDITKWQPDPTIIHHLVCQLVTSSLIVNKDIDLKQWITRHMEKKYDEIFGSAASFEFCNWAESYVEFILNHYSDENIPDVANDWDAFQGRLAEALIDELSEYPSNGYMDCYSDILMRYTN